MKRVFALAVAAGVLFAAPVARAQTPGTYLVLGAAHHTCVNSNDPTEVVEACTMIIHQWYFPEQQPEAYFHRGLAYMTDKKTADAIADFNMSIGLQPENVAVRYYRGQAHAAMEEYNSALSDMNAFLEKAPDDAEALNARAWFLYKVGRGTEGLADVNRALELKDKAEFWDTIAHIHASVGEKDAAIKEYRRALELAPGQQESIDGLEELLGNTPKRPPQGIDPRD